LIGTGGQILTSLGAGKIRVMGRERKTHAISGFDLQIVDFINKD
jgi:GTP cyclohydrolase II